MTTNARGSPGQLCLGMSLLSPVLCVREPFLYCRGLWNLCRLMSIPRKTPRTHLMSTTWWRTPPWYVSLCGEDYRHLGLLRGPIRLPTVVEFWGDGDA